MRALGVEPTLEIAEALYVGLVTDTGKFMYENTGVRAHVMAAELIDAGVDVARHLPPPLRGHALRQARAAGARAGARRSATTTGALTFTRLDARRLPPGRAPRTATRRASSTTCAPSRARRSPRSRASCPTAAAGARRSRCAPPTASVDVSVIARAGGRRRAPPGGGLHDRDVRRRARRVPARAGRRAAVASGGHGVDGRPRPRRQARGQDLARPRRSPRAAALGVRKAGHAGTLDPFATGLLLVLVGRARRVQRFLMALPKTVRRPSRGSARSRRPATPRARSRRPAASRRTPLALPTGRDRASARRSTRRARRRARRPTSARARGEDVRGARARGHRLPLRAALARGRPRGVRDRVLVGDLRAHPRSPSSATPTARSCGARGSARSTSRTPTRERVLAARARRWRFLPRVDARRATPRWRAGHGAGASPARRRRRRARRCCVDADGPVAIAEPREDGAAEARRRLPRVKVTRAPRRRAAPAPRRRRHVRRRPPRPPRGHPRRRHRRSPSTRTRSSVVAPGGAPRLLTTLERKAELDRRARRRGARRHPVRRARSPRAARRSFIDDVLVGRAAAPTHVSVGENFRFGHKARRATPSCCAPTTRFETRVVAAARGRRRGRLLQPHPRARARRRGRVRRRAARRAVHGRRARSPTATSAAATLGFPTANLVPADGYVVPGHGVYACRARDGRRRRARGGDQRRRAADVRHRAAASSSRPTSLDFDGDLYGTAAARRVPQAPARREALRVASTRSSSRWRRDVEEARAIAA